MKIKTKEQILEEIEIHKKAGATEKVRLLQKRLGALVDGSTSKKEEDTGEIPIVEDKTRKSEGALSVSPLENIQNRHEEEIAEKKDELAAELDKMKESGLSWKEITQSTGVERPWLVVRGWKKRQQ